MSSEHPPNGQHTGVTVCLSFDFDAVSIWTGPRGSRSPNLTARGEFASIGAHRLLDLMNERSIPTTWFIPGHTIDTFGDVCARVVSDGHEVGYHGYCHEGPVVEARRSRRAGHPDPLDGLPGTALGQPAGRAPGAGWQLRGSLDQPASWSTASPMTPRWPATTTRPPGAASATCPPPTGPTASATRWTWCSCRFDWILDDWPYFSYDGPTVQGLRTPDHVYDVWSAEFDYLNVRVGSGVFVLTMHPQCIGRGSRMLMLERLIDHMASQPGVTFATMAQVADDFRAAATPGDCANRRL